MTRYLADRAWLGGDGELARRVVIDVEGGMITAVTPEADETTGRRLDGIVIPGLVSAHSHAFHRVLRGRAQSPGDFWAWREEMYGEAARLDPGSLRRLAAAVFAEMLAAGITTVGEFHYLHHPAEGRYDDPNAMGMALVEAAAEAGIRLTLVDACYLTADLDGAPPTGVQDRFSDADVPGWAERVGDLEHRLAGREHVRLGVAAHSVRAVGAGDLPSVATVAAELDVPLHVHVSEQPGENRACQDRYGMSPIELLDSAGMLGPSTTLVHATHPLPGDVDLIAASGSGVCLCPITEADLADGIGPAAELAAAGVPLSLGSDSNAVIDLLEEARRVEHHDRLRLGRRGIHSPAALLAAATAGGAAALGWPEAGRIASGAVADLVVLSGDSLDLAGTPVTPAAIVMAATRASVRQVMVAGEMRLLAHERVGVTG